VSFLKDHLAPTLHNAFGQIIAWGLAALLASGVLLAFVKPLREFRIPLWPVICVTAVCVAVILFLLSRIKNLSTHGRGDLEIRSAHYGADYTQIDVTDRVRARVRRGVLEMLVTSHELCGADPVFGRTKVFTLSYSLSGRDRTIFLVEGSRIILP
jgi:hypothetical protein